MICGLAGVQQFLYSVGVPAPEAAAAEHEDIRDGITLGGAFARKGRPSRVRIQHDFQSRAAHRHSGSLDAAEGVYYRTAPRYLSSQSRLSRTSSR